MADQIESCITADQLAASKCLPCEGGVEKLAPKVAKQHLAELPGWRVTHDGERIRKDWKLESFVAAVEFFRAVARVAEDEQHHPDLHLESYRRVWIEIYTHAIGGLSKNDFILAAKIDRLPIATHE